jgi:predicted nucleotide-binding protein
MKYTGTLDELKNVLQKNAINGQWEAKSNSDQFRSNQGGIINLFQNGTINFQGQNPDKGNLEKIFEEYISGKSTPEKEIIAETRNEYIPTKDKVFVVYGHDTQSREQLELVLHKLNLNPYVLANTSGNGLTIIEALEKEIILEHSEKCKFGIVLLTPDDVGYSKKEGPEKAEPRARQNVVLEMGMLISSLGRPNVVMLKKGHLEVPSDASGILYLSFNDHVKEVVPKLVDRLHNAGFKLDPAAISNASS